MTQFMDADKRVFNGSAHSSIVIFDIASLLLSPLSLPKLKTDTGLAPIAVASKYGRIVKLHC